MKNILYTAICACSILCGAQAQTPGSEVPNLKKLYEFCLLYTSDAADEL